MQNNLMKLPASQLFRFHYYFMSGRKPLSSGYELQKNHFLPDHCIIFSLNIQDINPFRQIGKVE